MKFYPTRTQKAFLYFIFLSILVNFACSKDSDLLIDSVLQEDSTSIVEITETSEESISEEETSSEDNTDDSIEIRTASFSPIHDAHVQNGKGYNQSIIRLEEGQRTSYLMFDLSPINTVNGEITDATLQFTIHSDDGNGKVSVFEGSTNEWTESNLSDSTAPEADHELGSVLKEYKIGSTETIPLAAEHMLPEVSTLILSHTGGNDLAFASKEHVQGIGPKLVLTYEVNEDANEIVIPEGSEETTEEETTEEETTEEETSEEEPAEEETAEEETAEEETTEEETAEEETAEEETAEEETTEEETTEEETSTEESTNEEETAEEETSIENQEPMAIADATPSSGGAPLVVSFKGSNSTDDFGITSHSWDFKDGSTSTIADPVHTFTNPGSYEVVLTVNDAAGLSTTDTVTITVTEAANEAPNAISSANKTTGEAPLEVSFTGDQSTDDNAISSYAWNFKDGTSTDTANAVHTFTTAGTYAVELTVTDENGLSSKEIINITVTAPQNEAPVAVAIATPSSGTAPLNVQFVGDNSTDDANVTSYAWDFKDGSTAATSNPSHTFTTAGTYLVVLIAKDVEGLSSTKTVTVTVAATQNEAPVAVATANKTTGEAPLEVQFLGQNSTDDKGVTSYLWNFKDGATATNTNPSHTFTTAGSYAVDLTVKDAEGLTSKASVTITINAAPSGNTGGNAEPGYYVTTSGNSSNNGQSESSAWSIEHALNVARAGDIIYVKAGNYGNKRLLTQTDGSSGNPIRFVGYKNTPGDVASSQGSTFNYGDQINANNMPLFSGTPGQGEAISSYHRYIEFENFQITGYRRAVLTIERATNNTYKNIIAVNIGTQTSKQYDGFGFNVKGNNLIIENCFVLNAAAEAYNIADADYSNINYSKAYSNNYANPTDYYFVLTSGTNNTVVQNSYAERVGNLDHTGHGFDMKDLAENNTFKNCTAKNTTFELNFTGVRYNTIDGCSLIGTSSSVSTDVAVFILNGANNNTVKNMNIQNTHKAFIWRDNDDGFVGSGGDRDAASMGYDNTFDRITVNNVDRILNVGSATSYNVKASRNKFTNCNFSNFGSVAVTYYKTEDILFSNCSFSNGDDLVIEWQGQYAPYSHFDVTWQNCSWANVNFTPPN